MQAKGTDILIEIISKGGLLGSCASLYINDQKATDEFIAECSEQCHHKLIKEYFGEELVLKITEYCQSNRITQNHFNLKNDRNKFSRYN